MYLYLRLFTCVQNNVYYTKLVLQVFIFNNCYEVWGFRTRITLVVIQKIDSFILDLRRGRKQEKHITALQAM